MWLCWMIVQNISRQIQYLLLLILIWKINECGICLSTPFVNHELLYDPKLRNLSLSCTVLNSEPNCYNKCTPNRLSAPSIPIQPNTYFLLDFQMSDKTFCKLESVFKCSYLFLFKKKWKHFQICCIIGWPIFTAACALCRFFQALSS